MSRQTQKAARNLAIMVLGGMAFAGLSFWLAPLEPVGPFASARNVSAMGVLDQNHTAIFYGFTATVGRGCDLAEMHRSVFEAEGDGGRLLTTSMLRVPAWGVAKPVFVRHTMHIDPILAAEKIYRLEIRAACLVKEGEDLVAVSEPLLVPAVPFTVRWTPYRRPQE